MQQLKPMDSDHRKLANAFVGKSARACDNCARKRARWYCAADDAFLCQSCDSSVHSANPLARRHERVRLKSSSSNSINPPDDEKPESRFQISVPSWYQGFRRKPRTPRQKKHGKIFSGEPINNPLHLVPEICSEEGFSHEENEEQLLYRVPIFDPSVAELCTSANWSEADAVKAHAHEKDAESKEGNYLGRKWKAASNDCTQEINNLEGIILPSEMDLDEFAADVESLLGKGLGDESFDMEGLGLLDCDENIGKESKECFWPSGRVKVEEVAMGADQENHRIDVQFDMGRETFELNFDYEYSPITCEEEEEYYQAHKTEEQIFMNNLEDCKVDDSIKTFLKLDYEGIMSAWDEQKSPWMNGERPELNSAGFWPDCLGTSGTMHVLYGEMGMKSGHAAAMGDGGREARVSRYREKRRTRLFSKKIRYEVRKLNAEKRPRMKGRFVKRANFGAPAAFSVVQ